MSLATGQVLQGRYRIVKLLGQGGFGAVYRAWDMNLKMACALKENLGTSVEATRQFAREAEMLATLRHPNLPRVTDHFTLAGQGQYLVMDFIEGEDLDHLLTKREGPLPEAQVLRWMGQICEALIYLHSQSPPVIHRDIKPANIRITPSGQAILVDFGIAKVYEADLSTTMGARAVTPGFSPLEQYGKQPTDSRTDIYAYGATMYILLTGHKPLDSIVRAQGEGLPAPRSLNSAITPHTERVILQALSMMPEQRFQSAQVLRMALNESSTSSTATTVRKPAATTPQRPPVSRPQSTPSTPLKPQVRKWLWGVVGVCLLLLVGLLGALWGSGVFKVPVTSVPAQVSGAIDPLEPPSEEAVSTRLAFTSDRSGNFEIYVINADSSGLSNLTNSPSEDWEPAWSFDGQQIAFVSERDGNNEIYVMNADGSRQTRLTNNSTPDRMPAWSPDGTKITFVAERDGNAEIYVMDADGSDPQRLTDHPAEELWPTWSPDGKRIAFSSRRDGNAEIYLINPDGSGLVNLTKNAADDDSPTWSPDGTRLAFWSTRDDHYQIYLMNDDGSEQSNLTKNTISGWNPAWSADGTRLAFISDPDGQWDIHIINVDGSGLSRLTIDSGEDGSPAWAP